MEESSDDDDPETWMMGVDTTALFADSPVRTRTVRKRGWTPGFHEQVDLKVREVVFALRPPRRCVAVAIEYRANGTGSSVWDAAVALARYLELRADDDDADRSGDDPRDRVVLELGAGTGFVGLVAAALGAARATLTDLEECLPLMRQNAAAFAIESPGVLVEVLALPWGEALPTSVHAPPELILVADCLLPGATHLFEPLCHTILALLDAAAPNARALLAYEERMDCSAFFELLERANLRVERLDQAVLHPVYSAPEIQIHRITKRNVKEPLRQRK